MTIPVLFLLGAFGLSFVLASLVWLVSRPRKQKFGSTIETFTSDLSALAPRGSRRVRTRPVNGGHLHSGGTKTHTQAANARPKPGPRPRS